MGATIKGALILMPQTDVDLQNDTRVVGMWIVANTDRDIYAGLFLTQGQCANA